MLHTRTTLGASIVALMVDLVAFGGSSPSAASPAAAFSPGSSGAGDPYFPQDGNGGYDVRHYGLTLRYDPATERLVGTARITATATQHLSRFNLDFDGLTVRSIDIASQPATWTRQGGELTVTPKNGILAGHTFTTVARYDGRPHEFEDPGVGTVGFVHTDDGAVVVGEPHVASVWFPANDHPTDKASFTFTITVPSELQAVSNGRLTGHSVANGWSTWHWNAQEPMATYLATMAIGHFDISAYRANGLKFWDAVDHQLSASRIPEPRSGSRYAWSQMVNEPGVASYKRLTHRINVPAHGGQLSFWVNRDTEEAFDFALVEAHTVGQDNWTTLRDLNGHTSAELGFACPFSLELHPFLAHYQADNGDGTCSPSGTTGRWWAASGKGAGWEHWRVDLSRYAGKTAAVSIGYVSDNFVQHPGLFVDDVTGPAGQGTTSFEADGSPLDGWTVPGPPPGDPANPNDWITTDTAIDVPTIADYVNASLARQPEILHFESSRFGRYPFSTSGATVDVAPIGFALENQTRPTYSSGFFDDGPNDGVVVHELAHQWYGDSVALRRWSDVWLNEGFATYAEWLWSGHEGFETPAEIFAFLITEVPEDDPLWSLEIGDPGPDHLFDFPVYVRGAMTLQALRMRIGDRAFFRLLPVWATRNAGGNGDTSRFIALAERVSGKQLDRLFHTWLHTATKPAVASSAHRSAATSGVPIALRTSMDRGRH